MGPSLLVMVEIEEGCSLTCVQLEGWTLMQLQMQLDCCVAHLVDLALVRLVDVHPCCTLHIVVSTLDGCSWMVMMGPYMSRI